MVVVVVVVGRVVVLRARVRETLLVVLRVLGFRVRVTLVFVFVVFSAEAQ